MTEPAVPEEIRLLRERLARLEQLAGISREPTFEEALAEHYTKPRKPAAERAAERAQFRDAVADHMKGTDR